ncbi:hypothetical protein [Pseudarthrobacter sp. CCNWLW247]|uniref:hypothetical protein n=1 Tax=Pseudarthrobacter sp. CCNWLW247 TaxID=3127461 RepID=UPI0030776A31
MEYELEHSDVGVDLVVKGPWTSACQDVIATGTADGLVLNAAFGFSEPNLGFIDAWPITRLKVLARNISDLSPVYRLSGTLRELDVLTAPPASLDLSRLPKITSLGADWGQVSDTLSTLEELKTVFLRHFSSTDLKTFAANSVIESIRLKDRPKLISLDGQQDLTHLTEVGVYLATALRDISALGLVTAPLQKLELVACKGIRDVRPLKGLTTLKFLNLGDCGEIDSIRPLSGLQELEEFHGYGSTKIGDGDLSPLLQLPRLRTVSLQSRKNYTPSLQTVMESLHLR